MNAHDDEEVKRPARRRLEDLTPEEREARLRRFIWEPGDIQVFRDGKLIHPKEADQESEPESASEGEPVSN